MGWGTGELLSSDVEPFPVVFLSVADQHRRLRRSAEELALQYGALSAQSEAWRVVGSSHRRFVEGGYASLHYVRTPPDPHCLCLEVR